MIAIEPMRRGGAGPAGAARPRWSMIATITAPGAARASGGGRGAPGRMYIVVWRYLIRPGAGRDFERVYGPDGDWCRLFGEEGEYLGTELLRSIETPGEYMTIDRWDSESAYERFHARRRSEYAALDERCAGWTESETRLGAFDTAGPGAPSGPAEPGGRGHTAGRDRQENDG